MAQQPANELLERIRVSVIGHDRELIGGPYGPRRAVYADYAASARSLTFVEDFIRSWVLPTYANTHTEASAMGRQTGNLREEARRFILKSLGGDERTHALIFCGSGSTAAINKMVGLLGLRKGGQPEASVAAEKGQSRKKKQRPVVFVGPFEHHSNELPWRESIAKVVPIGEDADGHVDQVQLKRKLHRYRKRPLRVGSFSAASNVTGIMTDTLALSELLHQHGALALWDFAAAGPYVGIQMTAPPDRPLAYMDAVFLSPHKFVGGPGTPGILALRRDLRSYLGVLPTQPGGGTVDYVSPVDHCYSEDIAHREEGGTPAIIESIRAGLVFQLKDAVSVPVIRAREDHLVRRTLACWEQNEHIEVLGNKACSRLPIVSLLVKRGSMYLHHNYVVALLSDLFGIQARGGCSCAGPYGHRLLRIDMARSRRFQAEILEGRHGLKPGWVRLTFSYFSDEHAHAYVLRAVDLIAQHGWKLLGDYRFNPTTGLWRHTEAQPEPPVRLADFRHYVDGRLAAGQPPRATRPTSTSIGDLSGYLTEATALLYSLPGLADSPQGSLAWISPEFDALRWFWLPAVCLGDQRSSSSPPTGQEEGEGSVVESLAPFASATRNALRIPEFLG